jgi:hypothetical protein
MNIKKTLISATGWSMMTSTLLLSGCQQARVERWVEVPCQPHGFYVAPKGQSLEDVSKTCQVDKQLLYKHNAWLITQQVFPENTVVWLRRNPLLGAVDEDDLHIDTIDISVKNGFSAEKLMPLGLPERAKK